MNNPSFADFDARSRTDGYDEVIERRWPPQTVLDMHTHPFDARALLTQGEMWLSHDGRTRHLKAGEGFSLAAGTPHSERYGDEGCTLWVARRHAQREPRGSGTITG